MTIEQAIEKCEKYIKERYKAFPLNTSWTKLDESRICRPFKVVGKKPQTGDQLMVTLLHLPHCNLTQFTVEKVVEIVTLGTGS